MKKNDKSTLMAFVFFAIITLVSVAASQAQVNLLDPIHSPDTNPLFSTTGPNTIGKGHLQLSAAATGYIWRQEMEMYNGDALSVYHDRYQEFGGGIGLRYGLGSRFELFTHMAGAHSQYNYELDTTTLNGTQPQLIPSLGLKMMLNEGGHGWVPQMSLFARVDMPRKARYIDYGHVDYALAIEPVLGMQFRNRLGRRWVLDYGLSYSFFKKTIGVRRVYALQRDNPLQFNLMARWLATDRLMISAGMENVGGVAEVLWQATPDLQLKVQGGIAAGVGFRTGIMETNALLGVNWMLK